MTEYRIRLKGGPGSGHFGHKGRPGEQGGSLPKDASASSTSTESTKRKNYGTKRVVNGVTIVPYIGSDYDAVRRGGDFQGSSLKGYLRGLSYNDIKSVLGDPRSTSKDSDGKTRAEWMFNANGNSITLYDWKEYNKPLNKVTEWNIGGRASEDLLSTVQKIFQGKATVYDRNYLDLSGKSIDD